MRGAAHVCLPAHAPSRHSEPDVTPCPKRGYNKGGVAWCGGTKHKAQDARCEMAGARWTTAVTVLLCGSAISELSGQVTLGTGVRAATVGDGGTGRWRANQVVASSLRL